MIENWFATPIYFNTAALEIVQVANSQFKKRQAEIEALLNFGTWGDQIATTFDTCKNIISQYDQFVLEEFILGQAAQFSPKKYQLTESWVNYAKQHHYQGFHIHEHDGISGVYYMQTNGQDGSIKFHAPCPQFDRTTDAVTFAPQVGKIILFPSWLGHSVGANPTMHTRISISFNLKEI